MSQLNGEPGPLALVGGSEWTEGCSFDAELLERSGGNRVLVLPTAAAYEQPERVVFQAGRWFEGLGGQVQGLMVLSRADAQDESAAELVGRASFVYLSGGSPLHLRSVLKDSRVFAALREAWLNGAVVAGSAAGAMVLTDPMVDPRGGALTVGLGLVDQMAVVTHFGDLHEDAHGEKIHRSVALAPEGVPVAAIPERTALIRDPGEGWRSAGEGVVRVFVDGHPVEGGWAILPG
jgi:cyanophycinase